MGADVVHRFAEARDAGVRQFLEHDAVVRERAAAAAVFLGDGAQQEAHRAHLPPRRGVDAVRRLPRRLARREHVADEAAHRAAKRLEIVVEPGRPVVDRRHGSAIQASPATLISPAVVHRLHFDLDQPLAVALLLVDDAPGAGDRLADMRHGA